MSSPSSGLSHPPTYWLTGAHQIVCLAAIPLGNIGFGGLRWHRYFFKLEGSTLCYYETNESVKAVEKFDLTECIVAREKPKKGGRFHIFAIFTRNSQELVARMSSESESDAKEWADVLAEASVTGQLSGIETSEADLLDESSRPTMGLRRCSTTTIIWGHDSTGHCHELRAVSEGGCIFDF